MITPPGVYRFQNPALADQMMKEWEDGAERVDSMTVKTLVSSEHLPLSGHSTIARLEDLPPIGTPPRPFINKTR